MNKNENKVFLTEQEVIQKIGELLPVGFFLSREVRINKRYVADAVIYHGRMPFAIVEIKRKITNLGDFDMGYRTLQLYSEGNTAIHKILTDGNIAIDYKNIKFNGIRSLLPEKIKDFQSFFNDLFGISKKEEENVDDKLVEDLYGKMKEQIEKNSKVNSKDFFKNLTKDQVKYGIEISSIGQITFKEEFEKKFFEGLLGTYTKDSVCRYTSYSTINRILSDKKASACSIVGMNDKSECYYVNQYFDKLDLLSKKNISTKDYMQLVASSPTVIEDLNGYMIMSCTDIDQLDKLNMWRLYGDEAKGVCITYTVEPLTPSFILAPVSYAAEDKSHPELDFIYAIKSLMVNGRNGSTYSVSFRNLGLWQHFFKPYDYADEKEVRLLYTCPAADREEKYKWIKSGDEVICPIVEFNIEEFVSKTSAKKANEFPLLLDSVLLGPKFPENGINKQQLKLYANSRNLFHSGKEIDVSVSSIDNYR